MAISSVSALSGAAGLLGLAYLDASYEFTPDLVRLRKIYSVRSKFRKNVESGCISVYDLFLKTVEKYPDNVFLVYQNVSLTYTQVNNAACKIAKLLVQRGLKPGQFVCLNFPNTPSQPIWWLACMACGLFPSFINFNQNGKVLEHSIRLSNTSLVVFDISTEDNMSTVAQSLKNNSIPLLRWVDEFPPPDPVSLKIDGIETLSQDDLIHIPDIPVDPSFRKDIKILDPSALIYTSGTTGLPKGAICSHGRIGQALINWSTQICLRSDDRIFCTLPLYHSSATLLIIGAALGVGAAVIIVRKFSASRFFDEAREQKATTIHYIGEIPRYLLSTPPRPNDKEHTIRMATGNGMRPEVWSEFRERFGIPIIHEFFGSTEGNLTLNNRNTGISGAGAVGRYGLLAKLVLKGRFTVIKLDPETEEPLRDDNGICIKAKNGEIGELVSIIQPGISPFVGYYNSEADTKKKILSSVFQKGDQYFRFGDLVKWDGHLVYFIDRIGDTFRWRSENVSTTEVQGVLSSLIGEANVYGVQLPNHDGRAGCAAIPKAMWDKVNPDEIARHVISSLPGYARPIFIRIVTDLEVTGTSKHMKATLRKEGVNPRKVKDPLFWLNNGKYVPFRDRDWDSVIGGKVKL